MTDPKQFFGLIYEQINMDKDGNIEVKNVEITDDNNDFITYFGDKGFIKFSK